MSEKIEQDVLGSQAATTPTAAAPASSTTPPIVQSDESGESVEERAAESAANKPAAASANPPEDAGAEALLDLYKKAVHLPEPEPEYVGPDEPIAKMTHNQLRAMRSKSVETEAKVTLQETLANNVIKGFDDFVQSFKKPAEAPRRLKCLDTGHECIHCGKQFELKPDPKKAAKKEYKKRE